MSLLRQVFFVMYPWAVLLKTAAASHMRPLKTLEMSLVQIEMFCE